MAETETTTPQAKRVLVVMAHPDDGEFSAGGTIARWARDGYDIYYCLLTDGGAGDQGDNAMTNQKLVESRRAEAQGAADALGVQHPVIFLNYPDSRLEHTLEARRDVARVIRQTKPDIVICQDPLRFYSSTYINHPDHRIAGEITLAAIIPVAGTRLAFPELAAEGLDTHEVVEIYLAGNDAPDRWVDVGETLDNKIAALRAHKSQLHDWDPTERVRESARETAAAARKYGHQIEYAEAFKYIKRK